MSSLAGVFNACSTLFTMDLYSNSCPTRREKQLVQVGRYATDRDGADRHGLDSRHPRLARASTITCRACRDIWPRRSSSSSFSAFLETTQRARCLAALIVGFAMGIFRLAVDTPRQSLRRSSRYAEGSFFWIVNKIYFQYFSLLITLVSAVT